MSEAGLLIDIGIHARHIRDHQIGIGQPSLDIVNNGSRNRALVDSVALQSLAGDGVFDDIGNKLSEEVNGMITNTLSGEGSVSRTFANRGWVRTVRKPH